MVERPGISEHPVHVRDPRGVPPRYVRVELRLAVEQLPHARHRRHVPVRHLGRPGGAAVHRQSGAARHAGRVQWFSRYSTRIEKKNPISNRGINKKVDEIKPKKRQNDLKINSHEEWNILFEKLNLSVFATNYFSKLSFKEYKNNEIFLEAEEDFLDIPVKVVEEFEQECSIKLDQKIGVKLEIGNSEISPGNEKKIQNEINTKQAEENIKNDETIQNFLKKIDGRIFDDSIKPIN